MKPDGSWLLWSDHTKPNPHLKACAGQPTVQMSTDVADDFLKYYLHTPSGLHLHKGGTQIWTNGSVREGSITSGAGVWFKPGRGVPIREPMAMSIGGEPVIIRAEMGALLLAL